jgi:hypothetical protein
MDALSDIISLTGVPGRSSRVREAMLGCLVEGNPGATTDVDERGVDVPPDGGSFFPVGASRSAFEAVRIAGD